MAEHTSIQQQTTKERHTQPGLASLLTGGIGIVVSMFVTIMIALAPETTTEGVDLGLAVILVVISSTGYFFILRTPRIPNLMIFRLLGAGVLISFMGLGTFIILLTVYDKLGWIG